MYQILNQLRRMLFAWHGILQFISQSGFSFDSVFFSFTGHCYFMAILKTSVDTNARQSHRLTHCIKNLHCYNLKSLMFKSGNPEISPGGVQNEKIENP